MKTMTIVLHGLRPAGVAAAALLLAACATDPAVDNLRFGESVRHMITLQTADPNSGAPGLDGEKAETVLRTYRGDVAELKTTERQSIELGP